MTEKDYENFFNPGNYCILPGHRTQYCQERYCKGCRTYLEWKDPAVFKPIPLKNGRIAVVDDPGMMMATSVLPVLLMGERGKKRRMAAEESWSELIKAHPLRKGEDAALRKKCVLVDNLEEAGEVVQHLQLAMKREFGGKMPAGFAANQFGFDLRIIAFMRDTETVMVLINPEITKSSPKETIAQETCFSVSKPCWVYRPKWIKVKATLPDGSPWGMKAHDFTARVLAHEIDHLDGILITDRQNKRDFGKMSK